MTLPFSTEQFFDLFERYNGSLWPVSLALWVYAALVTIGVIRSRRNRGRLVSAMLAVQWAWAGIAYHAVFFTRINPAAWLFSAMFVVESALLAWYGFVRHEIDFSSGRPARNAAGWVFVGYALAYPLVVFAEGHAYPRAPTFGLPCPTTLLTVGFLLLAGANRPRTLAVIPLAWTLIAGSAALLFGVRADLMLWVGGVLLAVAVFPERRAVAV